MTTVATGCALVVVLVALAAGDLCRGADAPTPAHKKQPNPELNPWKDKGIASKYVFGAYYTRKNVDEAWNTVTRTDEFADVMVKFDNSPDELVFWRGDNYLPAWKAAKGRWSFERLMKQSDKDRPDKVNRNTHATIIESSGIPGTQY